MSANPDSVSNQGEFHSRIPPAKPMTTKDHAPGVLKGNDAVPEFHAETLQAGTAPADRTFKPNPTNSYLPTDQTPDGDDPDIPRPSAQDTIPGATSADVHTGLGKPIQGQSSAELHGDGGTKGKRESLGLVGKGTEQRDNFRDRGLDLPEGVVRGEQGKSGGSRAEVPGAEEREPVGAEEVAAERD